MKGDEIEEKMDKSTPSLFRETAFQEMRASERLDQQLVVVRLKDRLILYVLIFCMAAIVLWALFGSIPIKVVAKGVLIHPNSLKSIQTNLDAVVDQIFVQPGDAVQIGQALASLKSAEVSITLAYTAQHLAQLESEFEALKEQVATEKIAREYYLKEKINTDQASYINEEHGIALLEESLKIQESLLQKSLINATEVLATQQQLLQAKTRLEAVKASLELSKFELTKDYRKEDLEAKKAILLKAVEERNLALLQESYLNVLSPIEATVLEVSITKNRIIKKGDDLMLLERKTNKEDPFVFYAYVSADEAKRIKVGNPVVIQLANFKQEEFGSIKGSVKKISSFPVTEKSLLADLQNPLLIQNLKEGRLSVFQVQIELEKDPSTPTGYKWTSGMGPNARLTTGSIGVVKLIVERVRPIYYLIPNWKD